MEKNLKEMLEREALRGIRLRVLATNLAEYTSHTESCNIKEGDSTTHLVESCDCGLSELLREVDAL